MQVVVICGRNDALRRKLSSGQYSKGATQVHAFGFMKNMHEFMNACDAIITKAGAHTHAYHAYLPILVNSMHTALWTHDNCACLISVTDAVN